METQTAILSTVNKAVADVVDSSYVDSISENQAQGIANVSVVVQLTDEGSNEPQVSCVKPICRTISSVMPASLARECNRCGMCEQCTSKSPVSQLKAHDASP